MSRNLFFTPLTPWEQFRRDPACCIVRWLYRKSLVYITTKQATGSPPISIVCTSDTHCTEPDLPDGDVFLHAGDLTNHGDFDEIQRQLSWISQLPHKYKVVIAGNHDSLLDPEYVARFPGRKYEGDGTARSDLEWGDIIYLNNSATTLKFSGGRKLKVYGSPLTPQYGSFAFQHPPSHDTWTDTVPDDTDVLLTHGPPKGHLDCEGKGSLFLLKEVWRVRPRLVVFGHIHDGHGQQHIAYSSIEAAYDGVMMREKGFGAVVVMGILVLLGWVWSSISLTRQHNRSPGTTLINAAAMVGWKQEPRPAIMIEI